MNYSDLSREAWISITASRLRTFLAVLGIVIGVGSVILMLAVGSGSRQAVQDAINKLGSNLLIISPGNSDNKGLRSNSISELTVKDAEAIAQLPSIYSAAPATSQREFQVSASSKNWNTRITGTTPEFFDIRNWTFAEGQPFTAEDQRLGKRVAVIGSTVAMQLFGSEPPLGMTFRINGLPFQIIGVLEAKGQGFDGRDQDDAIFIPITTAESKLWGYTFSAGIVQFIFAEAIGKEELETATDEITQLLRQRNKLRETDADNFTVRNLTSIARVATDTTKALSILLGAIASISLIVGGIGIMNIMLVTVTERTREIGIRKAIGATKKNILTQFLMEAILIAGVGSLIGLATGIGLGFAAEHWMSVPVQYSVWSAIMALGVAVGVGLASGLYPAFKAAGMEPIEALRTN
jgi:putative ABC transport system permease protein